MNLKTKWMAGLAVGLVTCIFWLGTSEATSQERPPTIFFDDFVGEPPVQYSGDSFVRSDGSLVVSNFGLFQVHSLVLDAPLQSIETQGKYDGALNGGEALGLFLRGGGGGSYAGGIGLVPGELRLVRDDRGSESVILARTATDLDITLDTMLRLDVTEIMVGDVEGTRLELWAWQGDTMPISPLLDFDDPHRLSPPAGFPGLFNWEGTATFSFIDVASNCDPNSGGDLDGNGQVDFADFLILSVNFGAEVADHTAGDVNCNGTVELRDFLILSTNFGKTPSDVAMAASTVPEPNSLLLGVGLLGLVALRRNRRR